jgi:hypothetical protein
MSEARAMMVPMEVVWVPAWLTWVGATTACLRALGVDCDPADVAGLSGYAFALTVHNGLCPSGPTVVDWRALDRGIQYLGRSTEAYVSGFCYGPGGSIEGRAACHGVYGLVAGEVAKGRPCVIWGAYMPEFAVAIGVEDGAFLVKSYREVTGEPQPPIPCEDLNAPGGPYYLGFPAEKPPDREAGDRYAIRRAVDRLRGERPPGDYGFGLAAYDVWIAALEGNRANPFGNAYNAQCYAEGRRFAHEFLYRVARRNPDLAEPVGRAADAYGEVADAMGEVATLFPFPQGGQVGEESVRAKAVGHLRTAEAAETRAAEALAEACAVSGDADAP